MLYSVYNAIAGCRLYFLISVVLSLMESVLGVVSVTALIPLSSTVMQGASVSLPWPISLLSLLSNGRIAGFVFIMSGSVILKVIVSVANELVVARIRAQLLVKWTNELVKRQLIMPYKEFISQESGNVINLATREVMQATSFVAGYISTITVSLSFLAILVSMALVDFAVVAAGSVAILLFYQLILRPTNWKILSNGKEAILASRMAAGIITETMSGNRDIRLLRAEDRRLQEVEQATTAMARNDFRGTWLQAIPRSSVEFIVGTALMLSGIFLYIFGDKSVASALPIILFFFVGLYRLSGYASSLALLYAKNLKRYPSFNVVLDACYSKEHFAFAAADNSMAPLLRLIGRPKDGFRLVGLSVSHGEKMLLQNVNLNLPIGTITYLYGHSGSGKSSIGDVLARLHDPAAGSVFVDGVDASSLPIEQWRGLVGYVSQDPVLFSGSLLENIKLGNFAADREEVEHAIAIAGLDEFVRSLPSGLDTLMVERGRNVSGGQKCRIAIARSLLGRPALLILDESLGGVEAAKEADIISQLKKQKDICVLVVTHRKENSCLADQVAALENGRLVVLKSLCTGQEQP